MTVVHNYIHTCEQFLNLHVGSGLGFVLYVCLDLLFRVFVVSINYFILVLLAFVVLGLVSSVLSQQIGWEEHL